MGSISASARSEQTATDTTDGIQIAHNTSLTFAPPPAASAGISANPATVPADGQTAATIIVTLKDSLNRPSPGKTIAVTDAGAHAVITGPTPSVTDANGQIQFSATDQVNETVTFTATDVSDHLPIPGSGTVTYSGSTATACNINVAPVGGTGYSVTTYITGFPAAATFYYGGANIGCPGANNPTFTPSGSVLVSDFLTGAIYQSPLSGGTITSANVLNTLTPALGYEFTPHAGLELAYTYRDANAAQLHGNIASIANLTPLLRDTTEMLRDYGNIVSLSYSGHFDLAPRFTIEPRLGGFFWATKDTAVSLDDRIDQTHEGGGVTVGVTGAYRVWRGLELGVAIDHFRGFPNNIATFYGGTLEWRFGH